MIQLASEATKTIAMRHCNLIQHLYFPETLLNDLANLALVTPSRNQIRRLQYLTMQPSILVNRIPVALRCPRVQGVLPAVNPLLSPIILALPSPQAHCVQSSSPGTRRRTEVNPEEP